MLQRDKPAPISGVAARGEDVTVEFAGQKKTTKADDKGKWQVTLDPLAASKEPRTMVVKGASGDPVSIEDIVVGEVWIGDGRSNAHWSYEQQAQESGYKDVVLMEIVNTEHPLVRVGHGGRWVVATTPEHNKNCSALLLSFGVTLARELKGTGHAHRLAAAGTVDGPRLQVARH